MKYLARALVAVAVFVGCASEGARGTYTPSAEPEVAPEDPPPLASTPAPCDSLRCAVPVCEGGETTAVEGVVYDPAGKVPLYGALVYVPNAELEPLTKGATCDRCGSISGDPIATALTDARGHFRLEGVPAGTNVPLVVQIGKWRRKIEMPEVDACTTTTLRDRTVTLPRTQADGDIPKIAVVTGGFDELGCLLRRVGLDRREYSNPDGPGAVHLYRGIGGGGLSDGNETPDATELWKDEESLARYDMILLSCEGWEYDEDDGDRGNKTTAQKAAMQAYVARGGRVFATHYHYTWFKQSPDETLRSVATWNAPSSAYGTKKYAIDTSFPKGAAFAEWMSAVGATTPEGKVDVTNPATNVASVDPKVAQRWLYTTEEASTVGFFSFNLPLGAPPAEQCGRAVFSDVHVSGESGASPVPSTCKTTELTAQEKALEFMIFDLAACVQPDGATPAPPAPK